MVAIATHRSWGGISHTFGYGCFLCFGLDVSSQASNLLYNGEGFEALGAMAGGEVDMGRGAF